MTLNIYPVGPEILTGLKKTWLKYDQEQVWFGGL